EHARLAAGQRDELARQVQELSGQRDALVRERDELSAHCRRLDQEAGNARQRESQLAAERATVLTDRDNLERERDELRGHCERLEADLARHCEAEAAIKSQLVALEQLHKEFVERAMQLIGSDALAAQMQRDWDERARRNAMHFTNSERDDWNEQEYAATGEQNMREYIANDMENICQGMEPRAMRIVEIGCGAGRMTKGLAGVFGEVHAVDISAEMIRIARERLSGMPNVVFHHNNGMDLSELASGQFDFAMSFIVFQHIPSKAVIESYVREVHRLLKPGRLFKFQLQGGTMTSAPLSSWLGATYTRTEIEDLARRHGFELRYAHGEGMQDFWIWLFKKPATSFEPEATR
nr:methyltransferase domain-containing protein [Bryobacteraceae bacterium]